jgi:hypothetical protein
VKKLLVGLAGLSLLAGAGMAGQLVTLDDSQLRQVSRIDTHIPHQTQRGADSGQKHRSARHRAGHNSGITSATNQQK